MKRVLLWSALLCLALSGAARGEQSSKKDEMPKLGGPPPAGAPTGAPAMDMSKMQEQMRQMQNQMQKQQEESLERLRQINPQAYEAQKRIMERQAKIGAVMSDYQQKKISADDAERQLTPLIREEVEEQSANLDMQIKETEKKLANLKEQKSNPGALVKKRVDQMLGRGGLPKPDEMS